MGCQNEEQTRGIFFFMLTPIAASITKFRSVYSSSALSIKYSTKCIIYYSNFKITTSFSIFTDNLGYHNGTI